MGWDGIHCKSRGIGWDGIHGKYRGLGWDENYFSVNPMGYDRMRCIGRWDEIVVPSHSIRSPDLDIRTFEVVSGEIIRKRDVKIFEKPHHYLCDIISPKHWFLQNFYDSKLELFFFSSLLADIGLRFAVPVNCWNC
jgi:hypothetical protein